MVRKQASSIRFAVTAILTIFTMALVACASTQRPPPIDTQTRTPAPKHEPAYWQALARQDLDAVHRLIVEAHPGMLDELNPTFGEWTEAGYREALALIPEVFHYDSMLAVVRYYTSGFRDGHLVYSDDIRVDDKELFHTGWVVVPRGDAYEVRASAPEWPVPLPPLGSRLLGCDGRSVDALLRDVAPFSDRRGLVSGRGSLARQLSRLTLRSRALQRCDFAAADGRRIALDVRYEGLSWDQWWGWFIDPLAEGKLDARNRYEFTDGVLWIQAANFKLAPNQVPELQSMLDALPTLRDVRAIVFDTRGNGGGDSSVGDRIFEAATGGLEFDRTGIDELPVVHAQVRISDLALTGAQQFVERRRAQYGAGSEELRYAEEWLQLKQAAKAKGETWVRQVEGPRLDQAEMQRRNARLARFDGPIALVTDDSCASACLDFADIVLRVPGAIHLGQVTQADSVYIDAALPRLPSGNKLMIPLKVWRNRVRGNNEPLIPDVLLDLDALDEGAIRTRVVSALKIQGA